jgi:hypothetical protein
MPDESSRSDPSDHGECRALVVLAPVHSAPAQRPLAGFVTQLIACDRRVGQYRTARRAGSSEAAGSYAGMPGQQSGAFQRVI